MLDCLVLSQVCQSGEVDWGHDDGQDAEPEKTALIPVYGQGVGQGHDLYA